MIVSTKSNQIFDLSLIRTGDMFASLTAHVSLRRQQQHQRRLLATGNSGDRRTNTTISRRQSLNLVVVIFLLHLQAVKRFIGVRVVKPWSIQAQHCGCELARASL
jgi:hypothetical protein